MQVVRKYDENCEYNNILAILDGIYRKNNVFCALFGGFEDDEGWRRPCLDELDHLHSLDNGFRYNKDLIIMNPYILKEDIADEYPILNPDNKGKLHISDSIKWDYKVMTRSDILSFYISEKCANSMTLFELATVLSKCDFGRTEDRFKIIISINDCYPNLNALYTYLEQIIYNKDILYSIVNCHATPQSHALAIYNSYKYFVNK